MNIFTSLKPGFYYLVYERLGMANVKRVFQPLRYVFGV